MIDPSRGTVYVGSNDSRLYAISAATGSLKWSFVTGAEILSSPAVGSTGTVYVVSEDGKLYALNPGGTLAWRFALTSGCSAVSPCGDDASPAIGAHDIIYVGEIGGNFYAVHPTGTLKWKFFAGGEIHSSAAIGSDGTIYTGVNDPPASSSLDFAGAVIALTSKGHLKWSCANCAFVFFSSPSIAADGTIYIGDENGILHAIS